MASASGFPLWVIDGEIDRAGRKQVTRIPGASAELGWVNPRRWVCCLWLNWYVLHRQTSRLRSEDWVRAAVESPALGGLGACCLSPPTFR